MKRLLKISFDLALLSFIPILSWLCLSLIIDKNLINIFTLTYLFQFIWYILKSIFSTGANISKEKFNYKEHRNNAYKLLLILLSTILLMFIVLYRFYELYMMLVAIYFIFELINFSIYPTYKLKTCYLQLEYSAIKTTANKMVSSTLRMFISLLKIPFYTGLGQVSSSIYQLISLNIIFNNNFKIEKNGYVKSKN